MAKAKMITNNEKITQLGLEIIALANQTKPKTKFYMLRANGMNLIIKPDKESQKWKKNK